MMQEYGSMGFPELVLTPRSGALWYQANSGDMASRKDYPSIGNRGKRAETAGCLRLLLFL